MLSGIKYIVKTHSEEERVELRECIFSEKLACSYTTEDEYQLLAVYPGDVWYFATCTEEFAKSGHYQIFESASEFIKYYRSHKL